MVKLWFEHNHLVKVTHISGDCVSKPTAECSIFGRRHLLGAMVEWNIIMYSIEFSFENNCLSKY